MKKLILLPSLFFLLFGLLTPNVCSAASLQQDKQPTADEVAQLIRANASLKSQVAKDRTMLAKQIQQNESGITKLKADAARQQAVINDLKTTLSSQQEELSKVPEAIAARSYLFGKKRILAVSLIILAFVLVVVYIIILKKKVDAFIEGLKKVENNLSQKQEQENAQLKDYLIKETADLKAMLERQTHENKNRIVALLADANQLVHKMGDEVNKATDMKLAALKNEHGTSIHQLTERLNNFNQNKSL